MPAAFPHIRILRRRRLILLAAALAVAAVAVALIVTALDERISFFLSPSEVAARELEEGARLRVGGLVAEGSLRRGAGAEVRFDIVDLDAPAGVDGRRNAALPVRFVGVPPDLFAEGEGVIAEGVLAGDGALDASRILAKHDETYKPPLGESQAYQSPP